MSISIIETLPVPWRAEGWENLVVNDAEGNTLCLGAGAHKSLAIAKSTSLLIARAPTMLNALAAGWCPCWVHNAALTSDIEALRKIALWHADWNNNVRLPAVEGLVKHNQE